MPDETTICVHCQNLLLPNSQIFEESNGRICQECYNNFYFECCRCGEYFLNTSRHCITGDEYSGDSFCERCFSESVGQCANCGAYTAYEDMFCEDGANEEFCESCFENRESSEIYEHGHKPKPFFHRTSKENKSNALFFGFELECGTNDNDNFHNAIKNLPDLFYPKEDASIFDAEIHYGFEIVSHPFTWNWLQKHKDIIKNYCDYLIKNGFCSYKLKSCGLHIHVSKKNLTSLKIYKMLAFIYDKKNSLFLLMLSGRKVENLERWASISDESYLFRNSKLSLSAKEKWQPFRYTALNLNPPDTIEFRLFRGTLIFNSILRCFEFVKALLDFTENTGIHEITLKNFIDFVIKNKKDYLNLDKWLTTHHWRPEKCA
jgi:hypothetical protein